MALERSRTAGGHGRAHRQRRRLGHGMLMLGGAQGHEARPAATEDAEVVVTEEIAGYRSARENAGGMGMCCSACKERREWPRGGGLGVVRQWVVSLVEC